MNLHVVLSRIHYLKFSHVLCSSGIKEPISTESKNVTLFCKNYRVMYRIIAPSDLSPSARSASSAFYFDATPLTLPSLSNGLHSKPAVLFVQL